jgi:peptidoglycan L-alanyl-D-glutamate endopeptidase CwlK
MRNANRSRRRKQAYIGPCILIAIIVLLPAFLLAKTYFDDATVLTFVQKEVPLPTAENPNFLTQIMDCFLPTAAVYGYDLRITAGFRSFAQQQQIYDEGRTSDGEIVSEAPPGHSLHNYGYAVDVVDRIRGYDIDWTQLIRIANYCSLESGGPGDLPHFEYRGGLTTDQFAEGMRPPLLTLPCPVMTERSASTTPLSMSDLDACGAPKF